jgi:hemoglobin-like flavoprotein
MTPAEITTVKSSFDRVRPIADQAGALFYERLFTIDPALRPLFKGDIAVQRRMLMDMLASAVDGLDRIETIVPAVQALGIRHKDYGVKDKDYDTVAQALLWTLEQGLGETFTPETRAAWISAYTLLATTMQQAAKSAG